MLIALSLLSVTALGGQTDLSHVIDPKVIFGPALEEPTERSHKTYVIDASNGNDDNPGTQAKPFKTIRKGVEVAIAGDTVLVKNGLYREETDPHQAGVLFHRSGAPDAWIRVKAFPGAHPRVTSPTWATFRLVQVSYIQISGFDISTEKVEGQTDPNYQRNEGAGVDIERSHHVQIDHNFVHDCGGAGIGSGYSDYMTVEYNDTTRNSFTSIYDCSGISLWEGRDLDQKPGYHNIIRFNRSWQNENKGPTPLNEGKLTDGNGIIIDYSSGKGAMLIENNLCWDNGGRGIQVNHAYNVLVRNNTFCWNGFTKDGDQADLRANTCVDCVFANNIVVARPGQNFVDNWQSKNTTYSNNLLVGYGTISSEVGPNNLIGPDPLFRHASPEDVMPDFQLRSDSPAIGRAPAGSSPAVDFFGKLRPQNGNSDLGAIEH